MWLLCYSILFTSVIHHLQYTIGILHNKHHITDTDIIDVFNDFHLLKIAVDHIRSASFFHDHGITSVINRSGFYIGRADDFTSVVNIEVCGPLPCVVLSSAEPQAEVNYIVIIMHINNTPDVIFLFLIVFFIVPLFSEVLIFRFHFLPLSFLIILGCFHRGKYVLIISSYDLLCALSIDILVAVCTALATIGKSPILSANNHDNRPLPHSPLPGSLPARSPCHPTSTRASLPPAPH